MSLQDYLKRRNFNQTPEPKNDERSHASLSEFVVQKHDASALHYDLRLEYKGVLLSWAIPKGFSYDPNLKHLAKKVEDHPFSYKDFEGVIPEGNYGAGPVMIWDSGYFSLDGKDKKTTEENLEKGLKKGHFSFALDGSKLKGVFVLAKISNKEDWIIFKKKDQFANNPPKIDDFSVKSKKSMEEIQFGKASPMPHNIRPMMAETSKEPFDRDGWFFEIKWDGFRAISEIENGQINLYSRNLKSYKDKFSSITENLKEIKKSAVLDGEIVLLDERGKSDFQGLQYYSKSNEGNLVYYVFDLLYFDGYDLREKPLSERKNLLKQIVNNNHPHIRYSDHIENEGVEFFRKATEAGLEGIMAKDSSSQYLTGTRSSKWLKIKNVLTTETVIAGYTKAESGRAFFSSLILGMYNEKQKLYFVGQVGSGFSDQKLKELFETFQPLKQDRSPIAIEPKTSRSTVWLEPKLVCTVKFTEWTKDGLLRQPVFLYLRYDIDPKEVTRHE